jgi:DNA-damage-inducible protein J
MASIATLNIRVDENIKRDVERLYESLGINIGTAVNMFFKQCLIEEAIPFQQKHKNRHLTTAERLRDYHGDYKATEWDTGEPIGREVF